jgi:hypothetical protein
MGGEAKIHFFIFFIYYYYYIFSQTIDTPQQQHNKIKYYSTILNLEVFDRIQNLNFNDDEI